MLDFVALAETQTGKKVRQIRLDNAPEYRSKELKEWAASKGIILQYTTAYTHQQIGTNELGSDWLKELSMPPPPAPRNHGSADDDNDLVLLGDTIIVAPPIEEPVSPGPEQQILAEATAATKAADDCASNNPAVQEPTTQVRKRRKDYGPPTRHSDRLRGATESPAGPSVGSSAGLPAGPPTGPPAALLVQQQPPQTYEPSNIKEALTGPH